MKLYIILSVLLVVALAAEDKYTTKYDNIDLDEILKSDRLLSNYFKCLMEEGPCTPDGSELKKIMPDALNNKCAKCSEAQKKGAEKVIKFLIDNKKDMWEKLSKKYDPEGVYLAKYGEEARQHGINV